MAVKFATITGLFLTLTVWTPISAQILDSPTTSAPPPSAERGRRTLLNAPLVPASWPRRAYDELWKRWGLDERPADFDALVRERYGLHRAPFENDGLPMGLRSATGLLAMVPRAEGTDGEGAAGRESDRGARVDFGGVANDCLLCHAGSIAGESVIGLGNSSLDVQSLMEDLYGAVGVDISFVPPLSFQRGTVEAAASVHFLMRFRNRELNRRLPPPPEKNVPPLLEDVPAWWLLKKKKTMFHTGVVDSRAVRPFLTFMLSPLIAGEEIRKSERKFADILAFVKSIEAPKYPFAIDRSLATRGEKIFEKTCARCHGTYGADGVYPNRFVAIDKIGTDPTHAEEAVRDSAGNRHYVSSWLAGERWDDTPERDLSTPGYQAPPLDGVWATAPYFHNGSVPTIWNVLDSRSRPRVWTRSFRTVEAEFDKERLGWKITVVEKAPDPPRSESVTDADGAPSTDHRNHERRRIYDTTSRGRGNSGHDFGDDLDDDERAAVIEYLKTL